MTTSTDARRGGRPAPEGGSPWWRSGTIYQVYPRSFQDSDGNGVGDLEGIRERLPHLAWLGVDAVWLSPFFASPMIDFGYDVSDHCAVDPSFGNLEDWDRLVVTARRLGLRLILDLIANHTSDQHPWFRASREGRNRDWYLWQEGSPDRVPNNWRSNFGGSAWSWDEVAGAWYYHAYLPQQPDLNWRSEGVRRAVADVMRFWLRRGADGFRVDALRQFVKDPGLADNPPNPDWREGGDPYHALLPERTTDRPELLDVVGHLRRVADDVARGDGRERVLIGELYLPVRKLMRFYGAGLQMPANLNLLSTPWVATEIAALVDEYEGALPEGAWPNWVLGNHDRPRLASRVGAAQARVAAMLLLTLRGTPTLYYGDELGMLDGHVPPDRVRDPWERNVPGRGLGRDPARIPMRWDPTEHGGFCAADVEPWLPLALGSGPPDVAAQRRDPGSLLNLYRSLLGLRRGTPALHSGAYALIGVREGLMVYERSSADERVVVALNLGEGDAEAVIDGVHGRVLLTTSGTAGHRVAGRIELRAGEGMIVSADRPAAA